jgi:hypothetical protein
MLRIAIGRMIRGSQCQELAANAGVYLTIASQVLLQQLVEQAAALG